MKALLLKSLYIIVAKLVGSELFDNIKALVLAQVNLETSGEAKKAAVKAQLAKIKGDLGKVISETSSTLINLAIEAAVLLVKSKV